MTSVPPEMLEAYLAADDELSSWDVLADHVHEQGLAPAATERLGGARYWALDRRELTRRGFLHWVAERGPSLYALGAVLRAPRALLDELRVSADWRGPQAMVFGAPSLPQPQPPQHRVLPAVLDSVLASAPPTLRTLSVWIPANPMWAPTDDCVTQLEPLTRQRPPSLRHLTVRAPSRGLLDLLRRLAPLRYQSLRVRAPLSALERAELEVLAEATPGTRFVQYPFDEADPDEWVLALDGRTFLIEPGRAHAASEVALALRTIGLELDAELGLMVVRPDRGRHGSVSIDGVPLRGLHRLEPGIITVTWVPEDQPAVQVRLELQHAPRVR